MSKTDFWPETSCNALEPNIGIPVLRKWPDIPDRETAWQGGKWLRRRVLFFHRVNGRNRRGKLAADSGMCLWQASVRASSRYADAVGVTPRWFRFTSDRFCFILARNFARPGATMRFSRLRFKGLPSFGMTF